MVNIMIVFSIIAGLDKIWNNRFGLGEKFDEGFVGLGGLALTMIGIYTLSPIIASLSLPIFNPLAKLMNVDPSVFISSILAPDLGGLATSEIISNSRAIGEFNGAILSSMLGTTVSFTVPIAIGIISKEDFECFAKGILAGILTIPLGMIAGGIMMNIEIKNILLNLMPVVIISTLIIMGLLKSQDKMIKSFHTIGMIIIKISTLGLVLSVINFIYGVEIIPGMLPIEDGAIIIFKIAIILSGAYPLFFILSKFLNKYLSKIGDRYGIDEYSILGLVSSMANCIPMLGIYDKMNEKGKILNAAFIVSGSFVFGGQLAYISSSLPSSTNAFIVSKLVAGISAVIFASLISKKENI